MATTSMVPTVKRRLIELLRAVAAFSKIQIEYSPPGKPESETIFLGRTTGAHEVAGFKAGRKPRDERFTMNLHIEVTIPDAEDGAEAEARTFEILTVVENLLAETPRLGFEPSEFTAATGGSWESASAPAQRGWDAAIRYEIECHARLS